jgi:rare lipoprotein A
MKVQSYVALLGSCLVATPALAIGCFLPAGAQPGVNISVVAPEMAVVTSADPYCQSVDQVLARLRAPVPAAGAYKPLTKDDNSPWRFDMSQNGRRMTADEFDAWMKAKGIRVATGKPAVTPASETAAPAGTATTTDAPPVQTGK